MSVSTGFTLGTKAKGSFGPKAAETLSETALAALRSEQFIITTTQSVIGGCGDERLDMNGQRLLLPPVFGGVFSAIIADALTTRLWYRPGMRLSDHALLVIAAIQQMKPDAVLSVHTDQHAVESASLECGCAAIAKAGAVLDMLITPDYEDLIDERFRAQIIDNAHELLDTGYFQAGTAHFVDELEETGVQKEVLSGSHTGVAVIINDEASTAYNRPEFYSWCEKQGLPSTTFFEYSKWAMRQTARLLAPGASSDFFFAAADAFNMVVPYAICNTATLILERTHADARVR